MQPGGIGGIVWQPHNHVSVLVVIVFLFIIGGYTLSPLSMMVHHHRHHHHCRRQNVVIMTATKLIHCNSMMIV